MLQLLSSNISTDDLLRMTLICGHLMFCAFALTSVLKTDIDIVLGKLSHEDIARAASRISSLLIRLWSSGLAIIYTHTGLNPAIFSNKSKGFIKLLGAVSLTLNRVVLHHFSFPYLMRDEKTLTTKESILLVITSSLSPRNWMLAAFVGLSQPLGRFPFPIILATYVLFVAAVVSVSVFFIPLISRVTLVGNQSVKMDVASMHS